MLSKEFQFAGTVQLLPLVRNVTTGLWLSVEHVAVYVVAEDGETETLPDVLPPVEKLVPVHEAALLEDQVSVEDCPWVMEVGFSESEQVGPTVQLAYVYEPESVPFEHERDSETQLEPYGTVEAWYAVTLPPWLTVDPLNEHVAGAFTESVYACQPSEPPYPDA